jgi:hypothetical protein
MPPPEEEIKMIYPMTLDLRVPAANEKTHSESRGFSHDR